MNVIGSIKVSMRNGNLNIETTHTPSNSMTVEGADIPDLIVALVATLGPEFIYLHGQVDVVNPPGEIIAAYVAGDGTDPQRVAIADGIRSELYAKGADW